jgi:hypothetical protein
MGAHCSNRSPDAASGCGADSKAAGMFPFSLADDKKGRRNLDGSDATGIGMASPIHADPMKPLVMKYIGRLVAAGHAEWEMRENGSVQLRCRTGEIFLLEEATILRVA